MKKRITSVYIAAICFVFLHSCNKDIDLTGEYKQIPVIIGLLNQSEEIQYVRVNRTFLGPGNALEIAKIPDSNYFKNVEVKVTETLAGNKRVWILRDTILQDKKPGIFYTSPNKVYYFKVNPNENHNINSNTSQLNPNANYRLDVIINNGAKRYYATTQLVRGFGLINPSKNQSLNLNRFKQGSSTITEPRDIGVTITPGNATRFTFEYYFTYQEFNSTNSKMITRKYNFDEKTLENAGNIQTTLTSNSVYDWLTNVVKKDENVTKRSMISGGINVHAASEELDKFILASKPSSSIAQNKPEYSNIIEITTNEEGETVMLENEAIGLFGSRNTATYFKQNTPEENTSSRLFNSATLKKHYSLDLKFCSANQLDNSKVYYCD